MSALIVPTYVRVADRDRGRMPNFARARNAERHYALRLRGVAKQIGQIITAFEPGDPAALSTIERMLGRYAVMIEPWARATGTRMLAEVAKRDEQTWSEMARNMSRALREEIRTAPTGAVMRARLDEQVKLITSLPIEAGQRVRHLTMEALSDGTRAEQIAKEIMRSGEVTKSRANLIARTEVGRTSSELTRARAEHVGSEGFIWRAVMDLDTRSRHRQLDGRFFRWNEPPIAGEKGERYLPGCGPNCRCYPEVIVPDHVH